MDHLIALEKTDLVIKIAKQLDVSVVYPKVEQFADGEYNVSFEDQVLLAGKHILCIASCSQGINDQVLLSAFLIQAAKDSGAAAITGIIPYMPYARSGMHGQLIASLFEQAGLDAIVTIALHDLSLLGSFSIPAYNIPLNNILALEIKKNIQSPRETCLIAPDAGAQACVIALSSTLDVCAVMFSKERLAADHARITSVAEFSSATIGIIVDDMVTTGGTMLALCKPLKERGYQQLIGYCAHAVLAGDAVSRIEASGLTTHGFTKLYVSNTIPLCREAQKSSKIVVFDISKVVVSYLDEYVL